MDKQFMLFSKRKELAEEYEKWVNTPLEDGSKIKDCALSVITFMQIKGFCKIPENAVVLTAEQFSDYLTLKDSHKNAVERCEKLQADNERLYKNIGKFKDVVRKETAEKFAERLKTECFDGGIDDKWVSVSFSRLDEICKEITEGKL